MKSVKNVLTLVSFGRPAIYVGVLCPSKLSCDGRSVLTNPLVGHRSTTMALTAKQKKLPKALQQAILKSQKKNYINVAYISSDFNNSNSRSSINS